MKGRMRKERKGRKGKRTSMKERGGREREDQRGEGIVETMKGRKGER